MALNPRVSRLSRPVASQTPRKHRACRAGGLIETGFRGLFSLLGLASPRLASPWPRFGRPGPPIGHPLTASWHLLAAPWTPLGRLGPPSGRQRLHLGFIWPPFGRPRSPLATPWSPFRRPEALLGHPLASLGLPWPTLAVQATLWQPKQNPKAI